MKTLAIDIGASSGRCMMVEYKDSQLTYQEVVRFKNGIIINEEHLYWDIRTLFHEICAGIKKAFTLYPDIESVGIDTWGVDYGLINKEGRLVGNPYCYRDKRTDISSKEVLEVVSFEEIYNETGIQFLRFNTIFQLYYDCKYRKQVIDNTDKLLLIPDLLAYLLTGEKRIEVTNLSTTSLYNPKTKQLSKTLLTKLNIPERLFPKIIQPGETYGNIMKNFLPENINRDIPLIAVCTHDTGSAVLGTNGDKNFLYISSGTWSLIGTELNSPKIDKDAENFNFTNEVGYDNSIRFLKNTMGMFILNQLRDEWKKKDVEIVEDKISKMALDTPDIEKYLDPDHPLFELPGNMIFKVRRYINETGQSEPTFKGQWIRMIYQSMALKYRYNLEKLEKLTDKKFDEIIIVGGGNKAELLNQDTANACGIKVKIGPVESTVLGNAICQLIAMHQISNVKEARRIINRSIKEKIYLPENPELWDKKYEVFKRIVGLE